MDWQKKVSDDNIIEFKKQAEKENESSQDRILECALKDKCDCMYCTYRKNAVSMVKEFLAADMVNFQKNTGASFATFDMKQILHETIKEIKSWEKSEPEEEE